MASRRTNARRGVEPVVSHPSDNAVANESKSKQNLFCELIEFDRQLSAAISIEGGPKTAGIILARAALKFLEITGHGVPWLIFTAFYAYKSSGYTKVFSVNVLTALILDLLIVGTLKLASRRQRPVYNKDDMFATVSVDRFSFPSGHATRAVLLAILFMHFNLLWAHEILLCTWAAVLSASRVVLGRHHASDVIAGVMIGALEAWIVLKYIWIDDNLLRTMLKYVDDLIFRSS